MQLILYTRPGCHLCERLESLIAPLLAPRAITLTHRDIEDEDAWYDAYWSRIPVLMHDDRVLLEGRPDEDEVRRVIKECTS